MLIALLLRIYPSQLNISSVSSHSMLQDHVESAMSLARIQLQDFVVGITCPAECRTRDNPHGAEMQDCHGRSAAWAQRG